MTVLDFLRLTGRNWKILGVGIAVGLLAAFGFTQIQPKVYAANSSGWVIAGGDGQTGGFINGNEAAIAKANSYLAFVNSKPVYDKIAANPESGLTEGETLDGRLTAFVAPNSNLIEVQATASNPASAAALANGALQAVADVAQDVERQAGGGVSAVTVIPLQDATEPTAPVSPSLRNNLLAGGAAGLVLAYAFVFLRRALDVKVRDSKDMTDVSGVGSLGRIPKSPQLMGKNRAATDADAIAAESFRRLRTNLRFASVDEEIRSFVVTSANAGEGKTTIATSLAKVLAQANTPTIIIDADLRRPTVASVLGVDGKVGLSEVLSGQVSLENALSTTNVPGLYALPSGRIPPNPSEMLGSEAMRSIISLLSTDYIVVIDAPPLLPVTDAAVLSTRVDGVVLVATAGRTRKEDVAAARDMLAQVHGRLLGTVLNMVPPRDSADGYEYRRNRSYYVTANKKGMPVFKSAKGHNESGESLAPVGSRSAQDSALTSTADASPVAQIASTRPVESGQGEASASSSSTAPTRRSRRGA